jgi:hypothetical protein
MRVAMERWVLLGAMLVLLAGCSRGLSNSLPPSFTTMLEGESVTFTAAAPESGMVDPVEVVSELSDRPGVSIEIDGLSRRHPFVQTLAASPIFGLLRCTAPPGTRCATFDLVAGSAKGAYLGLYPGWLGAGGDVAWALVDAHLGVNHGHSIRSHDPRQ